MYSVVKMLCNVEGIQVIDHTLLLVGSFGHYDVHIVSPQWAISMSTIREWYCGVLSSWVNTNSVEGTLGEDSLILEVLFHLTNPIPLFCHEECANVKIWLVSLLGTLVLGAHLQMSRQVGMCPIWHQYCCISWLYQRTCCVVVCHLLVGSRWRVIGNHHESVFWLFWSVCECPPRLRSWCRTRVGTRQLTQSNHAVLHACLGAVIQISFVLVLTCHFTVPPQLGS